MAVTVEKLRKDLMKKIDKKDIVQVEKVERYVGIVRIIQELTALVEESELVVTTENGSQVFKKSHPALADIAKLNSQALNIEKSFVFKDVPAKPTQTQKEKVRLI